MSRGACETASLLLRREQARSQAASGKRLRAGSPAAWDAAPVLSSLVLRGEASPGVADKFQRAVVDLR
jgi:hypothetical protein